MLAFVVADVDPRADLGRAVNALRRPALTVLAVDVGPHDVIAAVRFDDVAALHAASRRMRECPGVRSTFLSLPEPSA